MLNVDLMRVKPLRGPLKRGDADELQKALKEAGVRNHSYWQFNSSLLYFINEDNYVVTDDICENQSASLSKISLWKIAKSIILRMN